MSERPFDVEFTIRYRNVFDRTGADAITKIGAQIRSGHPLDGGLYRGDIVAVRAKAVGETPTEWAERQEREEQAERDAAVNEES